MSETDRDNVETTETERPVPPRPMPCLLVHVRCRQCGQETYPLAFVPETCPKCGAPKSELDRV